MTVISTNSAAMRAQNGSRMAQLSLQTAMERLSTGKRINSAKDDAAGLAISERFTSQIRGLNQAARNANDGISLAQTAEGGLQTAGDLLQRIRELAVQAANGSNSSSDRASLQNEVGQLKEELSRVASTTQFNGQNVLDGSLSATSFQVGANSNQTIDVSIASAKGSDIGNYDLKSFSNDNDAISAASATGIDAAQANRVTQQILTVSGNGDSADVSVAAGDSAKAIADKVNAETSTTGVSASAETKARLNAISAEGTVTFNLTGSNGTAVAIGATVSDTGDLSSLAAAINAQSANTGISAVADGDEVVLRSKEGYDIKIDSFKNTGGGTADLQGLNAFDDSNSGAVTQLTEGAAAANSATVGGTLKFASSSGYTVQSDVADGSILEDDQPTASTLSSVATIDVSTSAGASDALAVVDAALTSINNSRASLGAIQNRFASTISNLQTTSENLNASRSRIQDTDFASETANLTRGQILQQAGTAILAQANSLPNGVLALLRG